MRDQKGAAQRPNPKERSAALWRAQPHEISLYRFEKTARGERDTSIEIGTHLGWKAARCGLCRRMRRGHRIGLRATSPTVALVPPPVSYNMSALRLLSLAPNPRPRARPSFSTSSFPPAAVDLAVAVAASKFIVRKKERESCLPLSPPHRNADCARNASRLSPGVRDRPPRAVRRKEESPIFLSLCYELSGKPSPSKIGHCRFLGVQKVPIQSNHIGKISMKSALIWCFELISWPRVSKDMTT